MKPEMPAKRRGRFVSRKDAKKPHNRVIPAEAGISLFFYQLGKGSEIPA
jgi:hypothetical protein